MKQIIFMLFLMVSNAIYIECLEIFAVNNNAEATLLKTQKYTVKLEKLEIPKVKITSGIYLKLKFLIKGIKKMDELELNWTIDDKKMSVKRIMDIDSVPNMKITYSLETYVKNESGALNVSLNIPANDAKPGVITLTASENQDKNSVRVELNSPPILPYFSKPKRVLQGDTLRISCKVQAHPLPSDIKWKFAHIPLEKSDDADALEKAYAKLGDLSMESSYSLVEENNVVNDTLKFPSLTDAQNGLYSCNATNEYGSDVAVIFVNVKNRWAALWPFIGIVVEVAILVSAILLYERHQMRPKQIPIGTNNNGAVNMKVDSSANEGDKNGSNFSAENVH